MPKKVIRKAGARAASFLPRTNSLAAYAAAAVVVAVASLARLPLDAWAGAPLPPFITYFPAIVVAGLLGGVRVGLATTAAAFLAAWYFWVPTYNSFAVASRADALTLATFALSGVIVAATGGWARLLFDRARADEAERDAAARETVHRIKNLIAVIRAIGRHAASNTDSVADYQGRLEQSLAALGVAQDVLLRRDWQDADLADLIGETLKPFLPSANLRVEPGPAMRMPGPVVGSMTLALYELATNAVKYGGLGANGGGVRLSWRTDGERCVLEWIETGCAGTAQPGGGLGSLLIKSALSKQNGGSVVYAVSDSGVSCVFAWPSAAGRG